MSKKHEGKYTKITTKTPYGSHREMVIEDWGDMVKCQDDIGTYLTPKRNLDSGLADPNRWSRVGYTNADPE